MSVSITVNGRVARQCTVLDDPVLVKKELEAELRKQRLLQVREESKQLAKKIRENCAREKERQLRKFEEIKAKEMNCWRNHLLAQKNHDYAQAIFQVGAAHRAAQVENEERAARVCEKAAEAAIVRKNLRARKSCNRPTNTVNRGNELRSKCPRQTCHTRNTCTQTSISESLQNQLSPSLKRKRCCQQQKHVLCKVCASDSELSTSDEDDSTVSDSKTDISSISITDSDTKIADAVPEKKTHPLKGKKKLQQTPALLLEVERGTDDALTTAMSNEFKDRHLESNRQFSHVIRVSPRKKTVPQSKNPTNIQEKENRAEKEVVTTHPRRSTSPKKTMNAPGPKRFTKISELIEKKKAPKTSEKAPLSPGRRGNDAKSPLKQRQQSPNGQRLPPKSLVPFQTTPVSASPTKSSHKVATSRSSKSDKSLKAPMEVNSSTVTIASAVAETDSGGSGRVQFFDYNNKFTKDYSQPMESIQRGTTNQEEPNAMQMAILENEMQGTRDQLAEQQRQRSEERGRKALEREQVRRDYLELTEKLESLTRQHPQLIPTDANLLSNNRASQVNERKEAKMNSAVEEILMRPAVITCPEVRPLDEGHLPVRGANVPTVADVGLNLGAPCAPPAISGGSSSSNSCCSMLLGYVDDQRQQLRKEITECEALAKGTEAEKVSKLKNLLERIETLRGTLIDELKTSSGGVASAGASSDNLQEVIDCISGLRKEREHILINETEQALQAKRRRQREKDNNVEAGRSGSEKRSSERRRIPSAVLIKCGENEKAVKADSDKPIEIIIKVEGLECVSEKKVARASDQTKKKPNSHLAKRQSVTEEESDCYCMVATQTDKETAPKVEKPSNKTKKKPKVHLAKKETVTEEESDCHCVVATQTGEETPPHPHGRGDANDSDWHNTYDTNSTSYRSLPPVVEAKNRKSSCGTKQSLIRGVSTGQRHRTETSSLDPTIAQYIQRLLGMSRNSIMALGVSSSEVETPSPSVLNTTANQTPVSSEVEVSEERLQRVQKFVNDNRGFIEELEQSMRGNQSAEENMRVFEEAWRERLCKRSNAKEAQENVTLVQNRRPLDEPQRGGAQSVERRQLTRSVRKRVIEEKSGEYAQMAENCSHRIAELTDLISKVRVEKQRLLEVTLSSVSEGVDGAPDRSGGRSTTIAADRSARSGDQWPTNQMTGAAVGPTSVFASSPEELAVDNAPLEKHKYTGMSRDSGISMSRPVTSQEQNYDQEPLSQTSSHTQSSTAQQQQRKGKPPPTLRRFSPQLIEDELAHELSTILEVETPVVSRINTAATAGGVTWRVPAEVVPQQTQPTPFPTFEEFIRDQNLDVTRLDPEKSLQMQHEFEELIAALQDAHANKDFKIEDFPSLGAYMRNLSAGESGGEDRSSERQEATIDKIEEFLMSLRLANVSIKRFPSHKEFMQRLPDKSDAETPNESKKSGEDGKASDSDSSINIEAELKRRKIIQHSFRTTERKKESRDGAEHFSSTVVEAHTRGTVNATESGIERLSSTDLSGDLQQELFGLGIHWPATMRRKTKETEALSGSTSTNNSGGAHASMKPVRQTTKPAAVEKSTNSSQSSPDEFDPPGNLRDFLTKELRKLANSSTGTSSSANNSDESLKSNFFKSVLQSLSAEATPGTKNGGGSILGRQKTSTPVVSYSTQSQRRHNVTGGNSSASTSFGTGGKNLFSGESHISSVHYEETHKERPKKTEKDEPITEQLEEEEQE